MSQSLNELGTDATYDHAMHEVQGEDIAYAAELPAAYVPAAPEMTFFGGDKYSPVSPISYQADSMKWPAGSTTHSALIPSRASQSSMDTQRTSGYLEPMKSHYTSGSSPHLGWVEHPSSGLPAELSVELPGFGTHPLPTTGHNVTYKDYGTINDSLTGVGGFQEARDHSLDYSGDVYVHNEIHQVQHDKRQQTRSTSDDCQVQIVVNRLVGSRTGLIARNIFDDARQLYALIVQDLHERSCNNPYLQAQTMQLLDLITPFDTITAATSLAFEDSTFAKPSDLLSLCLSVYAIVLSVVKEAEVDACARSLFYHASTWATNEVGDHLQRRSCIAIFRHLWCMEPGLPLPSPRFSPAEDNLKTNNDESHVGRSFMALICQKFYFGK